MTKTLNVASDIRAFHQPDVQLDFHTCHVATIGTSEEKEIPNCAFEHILKRAMDGVSLTSLCNTITTSMEQISGKNGYFH